MLEKPAVLGGHRRLDEGVGDFLKRHGVGELNAPLSDIVAVAVEEGDAELAAGAPVRVLGQLDRRDLEHEDDGEPARAQRGRLRQELHGKAPGAGYAETGEEIIIVCPPVLESCIKAVKSGVDPGIERKPVDIAVAPVRLENPVPHEFTPPPLN